MGRLARLHLPKTTTSTDPPNEQVQRLKKRQKQKSRKRCCRCSASRALSLLPETASLSPTAAKTVKHHTASMMLTFSPGLQHPRPQNVTTSADGEERRNAEGRNGGDDVRRICYTSDAARALLAASQWLPAGALGIFTSEGLK